MTDFSLRVKWLSRVKSARESFESATEEYAAALSKAIGTTATLSGMPSSKGGDKVCSSVMKLESARKKKESASAKLKKTKSQVYRCITSSGLQPDDVRLLVMIYLDGSSQNDAAKILGKTSAGGTYIHRRAVSSLKMPAGWHTEIQ